MFSKTSTFTKFFISASLVIIFLALCLTFALKTVIENAFLTHTRESTGVYIVSKAHNLNPEDFYVQDPQRTKDIFSTFFEDIKDPEIIRIKVWDLNAKIIYSDDETLIGKTFPDDKEYQESLRGKITIKTETRQKAAIYEESFKDALEVYIPITFSEMKSPSGVIEVYLNQENINSIITQVGIVQIFSTITFILAAFFLFYILFKFYIFRPISELIKTTKTFESGDLSKRVNIESKDEIGELGLAFNAMASKLQEYHSTLEERINKRTKELKVSEEHFHTLFDNSPVGIGLSTIKGEVITGNNAMQKMFGYSEDEIKKMNLSEIYEKPEDRQRMMEIFQRDGKVQGFTTRYKRKDGSIFDVLLSIVKYSSNDETLLQATIEDISAQKQAERELNEHTKELEKTKVAILNLLSDLRTAKSEIEVAKIKDDAILANIGDGLIVTDQMGKITLVNKSAASMLGWEINELEGQEFSKVISVESDDGKIISGKDLPIDRAIRECKAASCVLIEDYFYIRKDKTKLSAALTVSPLMINHKIIGAVQIFRDVSKEKEIDRMKTEFLSIAAHQLRTPLGSMRWSFEMLLGGDLGEIPTKIREMITKIYESNQSMISLVNDLLDVSRIEQGKVPNNPKLTDVVSAIKTIIEQLQMEAKMRGITLNFDPGKDKIPEIMIDPVHLCEIIENLVVNGIRYNVAQGRVDITLEKLDSSIKLTVINTGRSIPKNEQIRLFTKFFRGSEAIKSEARGTGLGLFVVKSYVEAWGGKVWVKSPVLEDNQGTAFYVEIPLKPKI